MATVVTLGGVECNNDRAVHWRLTQGVAPYQEVFRLPKAEADALFASTVTAAGASPVSLSIASDHGTKLFQNLYLIQQAPSRAPYLTDIVVADIRWLWKRRHIIRHYNIRRHAGNKLPIYSLDGKLTVNTVGLPDSITYAAFSLNPATKKPWTALEVVADVVSDVTGGVFDATLPDKIDPKELPVEGFELDDAGDEAVARVLQLIPELTVWVDADGFARLTLRSSGEEAGLVSGAGPPIVGPSLSVNVALDRVRPSRIEVYFTCEDELRFDYLEPPVASNSTVDASDPPPDPLSLINVLPLPDPSLSIVDATTGKARTVYQGTWVPLDQNLLDAWNTDPNHPMVIPLAGSVAPVPLTLDVLQQVLWSSPGCYSALWEYGILNDPTWPRRWSALTHHYRQTYQVNPRWMQRIKTLTATRAAILDPTTGLRQTAQVWQNCTMIPSARRLWQNESDVTKVQAWPSNTFVADAKGRLPAIGSTPPAPSAMILVLDAEQGVFRVAWRTDAYGDFVQVVPTALESKWLPGRMPSSSAADQIAGTAGFLLGDMRATAKHAVSVVLTATPGSPQGLPQLFRVDVAPDDAKKALPSSLQQRIGACNGPPWQLRVGTAVLPARFVWDDNAPGGPGLVYYKSTPRLGSACINLDQVTALARAVAASIYAFLADHLEGAHVTDFNPDAEPRGRVRTVEHTLTTGGGLFSTLAMPTDTAPQQDPFALMPESVRRMILGLVRPPGTLRLV